MFSQIYGITSNILSDITLSKGNELDFTTYVEIASKRSALWCKKFIEKLYEYRLNDSLPIQMKGVAKPWIKHPKKDKDLWYKTSLAWISIGYETKIPPIYTLTFFNAIANGGKMVKPMFVHEIRENGELVKSFPPEVMVERICKPSTLKDVQETLKGVVDGKYAMARNVKSELVTIAGKTGTALVSQGTAGYRSGET